MKFTKHINLTIEHNPHVICCEPIESHIDFNNNLYDFESEDEKQKVIKNNDLWICHWYPNTIVGFNCIASSSFERLLEILSDDKKIEEILLK